MVKSDMLGLRMPFCLSAQHLWNYYAVAKLLYPDSDMAYHSRIAQLPSHNSAPEGGLERKERRKVLYNYRFTTALQIVQKPAKSKYDLDRDVNSQLSTLSKCILICSLRESISIVLMILSWKCTGPKISTLKIMQPMELPMDGHVK